MSRIDLSQLDDFSDDFNEVITDNQIPIWDGPNEYFVPGNLPVAVTGDIPSFTARLAADQVLTTSWADVIGWNVADLITTDNFSWDETTGELTILEDGIYYLHFALGIDAIASSSRSEGQVRLLLNGSEIAGSNQRTYNRNTSQGETNASFGRIMVLTTADVIKLQVDKVSGGATLSLMSRATVLNAFQLKAPKGDKGDSGDILVKNSVEVDGGEIQLVNDELNPGNDEYYGTDAGGVKGWFPFPSENVYGSEFNVFESYGVSTTTTTFPQTKITGTTSALPVGKYKVSVSFGFNNDNTSDSFISWFFFDGSKPGQTTLGTELNRQEPKDSTGGGPTGSSQKFGFNQDFFIDVTVAGPKSVLLQWATSDFGEEASIWDATIEVIRVQ